MILAAAAEMLTEMPTAEVTLVELARRVGLARSNVMRYFESREAVLLELLSTEVQEWLAEIDADPGCAGSLRQRGDHLATLLATSLLRRPVLCDLISAQSAVLERNVSTEVALRHKRASARVIDALSQIARRHVPELSSQDCLHLVTVTFLMTAAAWPNTQPPEALLAAYAADAAVGAMQMDFTEVVQSTIAVTVAGLMVHASLPASGGETGVGERATVAL